MNLDASNYSWVDNNKTLAEFCGTAAPAEFAIDTEFYYRKTYYPVACLIQLAHADGCALIDPRADITDWAPLNAWLKQGVCLMHAADEDLRIVKRLTGQLPSQLIDTQPAGTLCGGRYQVGLAPLAEDYMGIEMSKSERDFDWRTRPLPNQHKEYAALDALILLPLWQVLKNKLDEMGRTEWALEEGRHILKAAETPRAPRIPKQGLGRRAARVQPTPKLRCLAAYRQEAAQKIDIPQQWVMTDDVLFKIAQSNPTSVDAVSQILNHKNNRHAKNIWELLQNLPEPETPPPYLQGRQNRHDQLKQLREKRAEELELDSSIIATNLQLMYFACHKKWMSPLDSGWRHQQYSLNANALSLPWPENDR